MASMNKEGQGTQVSENTPIEQLWYTWSDRGIDTLRAGFRIRAASPGLSDPRSELVQRLDRYQRYSLPKGADDTIPLNIAPRSLALIYTGKEYILVHKTYTGRDGVGRYGAFFVHLLTNLPATFSPCEAISLWRSRFWHISDDVGQANRHSTMLKHVSLNELLQEPKDRPLDTQRDAKLQAYLPYFIEAYLTKTLRFEEEKKQRHKLYIAASDDVAAGLIDGLIYSLPRQLLKQLTFSTYECDVHEAATEIVGTCWLSSSVQEQNPLVKQLLPAEFYEEKLAINCYTGKSSPLENHPHVLNHPLANLYAQDATDYFLSGSSQEFQEFQDLLDTANSHSNLTVRDLLRLYEILVIEAQKPSQAAIEDLLKPFLPGSLSVELPFFRSPLTAPNDKLLAKLFSGPGYQNKLFALILNEPDWWTTYRVAILNIRKQRPSLVQELSSFSAKRALPTAVEVTKREIVRLKKNTKPDEGVPPAEVTFKRMIDLMYCATPPDAEANIWRSLLQELRSIKDVLIFFHHYWDNYANVMKLWSIALPTSQENTALISPLLVVPWDRYGSFLALHLPLDWIEIATKPLVLDKSSPQPTREIVAGLKNYHLDIENLLLQLAQEQEQKSTLMATALFGTLVKGNYQAKLQLFSTLLSSPMGMDENVVKGLLSLAQLSSDEQVSFLEQYGPRYLLNKKMENTILSMFRELVSSNVQSGDEPRLLLLNIWLSYNLQQQTLEKVLNIARLNHDEKRMVLLNHWKRYLPLYSQSPVLLEYIEEFLDYLRYADITLFKNSFPPKEPSAAENLLWFLYHQQIPVGSTYLLRSWCNAARFIRDPTTLQYEWQPIAVSIDWLLISDTAQEPMSTGLLRELARVLLADVQHLTNRFTDISSVFSLENAAQLLYSIAEGARDNLQKKRFVKTSFEPYILLALRSQTFYQEKAEQEAFVKRFLDTLLQNADAKTLSSISKRARQWPDKLWREGWQHYVYASQHAPLPGASPSLVRRITNHGKTLVAQIKLSNPFAPSKDIAQTPTIMLTPTTGQDTTQIPATSRTPNKARVPMQIADRRVGMILLAVVLITVLLVTMSLIYAVQASTHITLTVTAKSYSQPMTLQASTDGQPDSLPAQQITLDFNKKGTGHATGTKIVNNVKAKGLVCFTNAGDNTVEIPINTTVSTNSNIQFTTAGMTISPPHSTCTHNPVTVPIEAVEGGAAGNVAANTIATITPNGLNIIAGQNNVTANTLKLTVSNAEATNGGGAQPEPAITGQDLDNVKSDLSNQLKSDFMAWAHNFPKDKIPGQPMQEVTLVNTQPKDTTLDNGNTFPAEVDAKVTILLVSRADLQKAALSRLSTALSQDKAYSNYGIAENAKSLLTITNITIQSSDAKSMKLKFSASAPVVLFIDKVAVQNLVAGKSPATAQQLIMDRFQEVLNADIQVQPGFFPWIISPWPNRVNVTILPGPVASNSQAKT